MAKSSRKKTPKFIDHDLLGTIQQFIGERGMSPSTFGRRVANDAMLVKQLRDGREIRHAIRSRIMSFIAEQSDRSAAE